MESRYEAANATVKDLLNFKYKTMIKLQVIGNLGKDALVNTVNGKNVINFSVAHTEKWKDTSGTAKEKTTWVECAYWTEKQGVVPYLLKGTNVYVEGTPDVRTWESKDGGKGGSSLSVRVYSIQLLGSGKTADEQQPANTNSSNNNYINTGYDLPF